MPTFTTEQLERWIDRPAIDKEGHRLGTVADVYVDDATGRPEWLAVTTGLFGSRMSFVPLAGANDQGDKIQVAYQKSLVKDSPNIDADGQLTEDEEERLYRHYGLAYGHGDTDNETIDVAIADLQQAGSATLNGEISPEVARTRLRKRDEAAVESIDLRPEGDLSATESSTEPIESESTKN